VRCAADLLSKPVKNTFVPAPHAMGPGRALTLVQVLDAEAELVAAGHATICGAPSSGDTPAACARISSHLVDGHAARESHAHRDGDPPTWTTWLDA
jgi:hypothetical protein